MSCRLGIDVGGTFTDLLLCDDSTGKLHWVKTLSTPQDPSQAIVTGLQRLLPQSGVAPAAIARVLYSTTVPANLILEQKGAKVGLLTTEHFEQVLHLARSHTPAPLAGWMAMRRARALADLEHTLGITERMDAQGEVRQTLDETQARGAVQQLLAAGVESIAVSLLHSCANPAHERRLRELAEEAGAKTAVPVSLASDLSPRSREYERTLAAAMNAYLCPAMRRYLGPLEEKLSDMRLRPRIQVLRSDGGSMSASRAAQAPVHALLSSAAAGVAGAAVYARLAGYPNALGCDMGGTTTAVSLIRDGKTVPLPATRIGAYTIELPAVEAYCVAAGGGSIAEVTAGGVLQVGPRNVGALPGPACFGRGGVEPTVTDANLVLGRLPARLLGGEMELDAQAAEAAIARIGQALGMDVYQAAHGILAGVHQTLQRVLRLAAVQQGLDPRAYALLAGGGAGPLHANAVALLVGCYPVIVPPAAEMLSAMGLLHADLQNEFEQAYAHTLADTDPGQVTEILTRLGCEADAWLAAAGITEADRQIRFEADLRYHHQGDELALPIAPEALAYGGLLDLRAAFDDAHQRRNGFKRDASVEIINLRALGIGRMRKPEAPKQPKAGSDPSRAMIEQSRAYFDGGFVAANIYDRALLAAGNRVSGPAIVVQKGATTVIHPRHVAEVDEYLNILITPDGFRTHQGIAARP
ncbi:MAG: hydantoinase/oxoprolinase family protein [Gammaproteobacteria bacterium]